MYSVHCSCEQCKELHRSLKNSEQCNSLACVNSFLSSVLIFLTFILKKTSLEWILYLIIFYLILLHAKNIMETVIFIGCISYVMKL
jgi:hypothetical protein